jgi:sigma-B regulation protein RsbU (phosphoserine phosphatase)
MIAPINDDDPDINLLFQMRLRRRGMDVRSAPDGESALDEIRASPPDLMLLDISMPGMSGLDVLERIREDKLDIAVIMTTAFGSENVAIDALRQGADDYLRKPFEPVELRAVVDRTLSRLQLRRQNELLRKQLDDDLRNASTIQRRLLPEADPVVAGYDIASRCEPARVVGGDFYDWRLVDDEALAFSLGDVMGKGMPAALLMATARASLRPAVRAHDPATAVNLVSHALEEDLDRTQSFVTAFVGRLDTRSHRLEFVDAGHGLAVVVRHGGGSERLVGGDLPLGLFPDVRYHGLDTVLEPGDTLLVYSDGLQDAIDVDAEEWIEATVRDAESAGSAVDTLVQVAISSGNWADDVTVIVIRRTLEEGAA